MKINFSNSSEFIQLWRGLIYWIHMNLHEIQMNFNQIQMTVL